MTALWSYSELRLFVDAASNDSCHLVNSKAFYIVPNFKERKMCKLQCCPFYENFLIQEAKWSALHLASCDAKIIFMRAGTYNLQAILTGQ